MVEGLLILLVILVLLLLVKVHKLSEDIRVIKDDAADLWGHFLQPDEE